MSQTTQNDSQQPKSLTVYDFSGCSTCKSARKWLEKEGIPFEVKPIVDRPPTLDELRTMLTLHNGQIRRLFNTSGLLYREMRVGEKLSTMSTDDALNLLAKNGKLVKRPFAILAKADGKKVGLLGFKEPEWAILKENTTQH